MNRNELYIRIRERAIKLGWKGDVLSLSMDIESADLKFHLRLDDWLHADDYNFLHDIAGITSNIDRTDYPATNFNFFVPRFAKINASKK